MALELALALTIVHACPMPVKVNHAVTGISLANLQQAKELWRINQCRCCTMPLAPSENHLSRPHNLPMQVSMSQEQMDEAQLTELEQLEQLIAQVNLPALSERCQAAELWEVQKVLCIAAAMSNAPQLPLTTRSHAHAQENEGAAIEPTQAPAEEVLLATQLAATQLAADEDVDAVLAGLMVRAGTALPGKGRTTSAPGC